MVLESRYRSSISEDGTNFSMSMVWVLSRARLSSSSSATGRYSSFPCFDGSGAFRNGSGPGLQRPGPPIFRSCASVQNRHTENWEPGKENPPDLRNGPGLQVTFASRDRAAGWGKG